MFQRCKGNKYFWFHKQIIFFLNLKLYQQHAMNLMYQEVLLMIRKSLLSIFRISIIVVAKMMRCIQELNVLFTEVRILMIPKYLGPYMRMKMEFD